MDKHVGAQSVCLFIQRIRPLLILLFIVQTVGQLTSTNEYCEFRKYLQPEVIVNIRSSDFYDFKTAKACHWTIHGVPNYDINLQCFGYDISGAPKCANNELSISFDGYSRSPEKISFCTKGFTKIKISSRRLMIELVKPASPQGGVFECSASIKKECLCGYFIEPKIVGGKTADYGEFPSMVGIMRGSTLECGAVLISTRYVLSAAHCLVQITNPKDIYLLVGETRYDQYMTLTEILNSHYNVESIQIHPLYDPQTAINDIGILKTDVAIKMSPFAVVSACLPFRFKGETFANQKATIVGWGTIGIGQPLSDQLKKATVNVISNKDCLESVNNVTSSQMCTHDDENGACQYDSGGPLYIDYEGRRYVIGLISNSENCGKMSPSVNTRLTKYLNWIEKVAPDSNYCSPSDY